jgi:hypothetical protein
MISRGCSVWAPATAPSCGLDAELGHAAQVLQGLVHPFAVRADVELVVPPPGPQLAGPVR